ncbi:trigger factor [Tepidibacter aestuarii]|uniref:trigger factor n=1 Tax=Tepidibacter aestuarii TaxID=2925782 RepID=UPI0020BFBD7B|nr:FKBP-type peptidyl-prolyl cis-trans isomerase [Tepidibacter aestuarii]CAH2213399.1 trigger factor [Tepidibacter aestuarii]
MKVQLGQYKGIGLKRPDVNVKDEEINNYINKIRENYKVEVEKEGFIENGDYTTMDYDGYQDGLHIPEASGKNYHLRIGQGFFLDEFEEHLLGMRKGDTVKFDLVLPSNYQVKHLRDETIHFEVKISSVMNRVIPELTDDVVKRFKIEGINTIDELKEYAKDKIYYQKMMKESARVINEIMHKVIDGSNVELKDEEMESLKQEILEDFKNQLKGKNANLELYLSYTKKTEEEILEQCKIEAETYLIEKAIIEKIAEVENITLNDEEKEKYENIEEDALNELLYQKVIHFLLKENTIIIK